VLVDTSVAVSYFSVMVPLRQETKRVKMVRRPSVRERKVAGLVVCCVVMFFGGLWLLQRLAFDFGLLFGPCGVKQRTGLPCPTCGMTTSVLAFVRGDVLTAFFVQPAAAFLCTVLTATAFFAFLSSAFGIYFSAFDRLFAEIRIKHWIVGLLIVIAGGWAVTFTRAWVALARS
jgi:hypothetical protein